MIAASAAFRRLGKAVETAVSPAPICHRAEAPVLMKPPGWRSIRRAAMNEMVLAYAAAYPEEIQDCLALHAHRDFAGLKDFLPGLELL